MNLNLFFMLLLNIDEIVCLGLMLFIKVYEIILLLFLVNIRIFFMIDLILDSGRFVLINVEVVLFLI